MATFVTWSVFRILSVLIVISAVNPWLLLVAAFVFVCVYYMMKHVVTTMIETQRLDSIYRSPVNTIFSQMIGGMITMRAYGTLDYFKMNFDQKLEIGACMTFSNMAANRYLSLRLDGLVFLFGLSTSVFCAFSRGVLSAEMITFTLQNLTDILPMISITLRFWTEFENYMTSSQSMYDYTLLESEDELAKDIDEELKSR